jgi:nucleotide-binding universal stress UspA family protein
MPDFSVILVPTDLTERTVEAITVACSLACGRRRLIVVHVLEGHSKLSEDEQRAVEDWLAQFRKHNPSIEVELVIRTGRAAEEILRIAAEAGCGLIIVSTHARAGLDRLLMGSVAEDVLRGAHCPVLCLKSPDPGTAAAAPTEMGSFLEID